MSLTVLELNQRSAEVFRELVDAFIDTGEPVGSRTLSRRLKNPLSPATIRNVMADLEEAGLLFAPHTSAGRLPTEKGLRFFVNGILEVGDISTLDREEIEKRCKVTGHNIDKVLDEASHLLSGLSSCAGFVMVPKLDSSLKHVEFVQLNSKRALVIMISEDGLIENRMIDLPENIDISTLNEAANYLNHHIKGKRLSEVQMLIKSELESQKSQLNELTAKIVEAGLAVWAGNETGSSLIIKGQSNLLQGVTELEDLEQIRNLFQVLDTGETLQKLLDASIKGEGVQIFIGAENSLFSLSGCSLIVSPYKNTQEKIIGAVGVIGPSRMNYGRIIPLVDYTAKIVSKILG